MSEAGWRQFHVAETEKYAHVTYFFNGGIETPWPGEDRRLIPSPKVATYDLAAGDVGGRRHRRARRGDRLGRVRLHRRELRQPGHGRPHRGLGRDDRGASPSSMRALARVVEAIERSRRADPDGPRRASSPSPPTTATPTTCATRTGRPGHGPLAQPGAVPADGPLRRRSDAASTASSPTSRRPSSSSPTCRPGRPSPVARCWRPTDRLRAPVVASAAVRTEVNDS